MMLSVFIAIIGILTTLAMVASPFVAIASGWAFYKNRGWPTALVFFGSLGLTICFMLVLRSLWPQLMGI